MIVKILEFYSGDERAGEDDSIKWWYYGDLVKVSVSPLLKESIEQFRTHDEDVSIMFSSREAVSEQEVEYKRLICKRSDDSEFSIVFDTVVYLLNDKGETIEKIVVNVK